MESLTQMMRRRLQTAEPSGSSRPIHSIRRYCRNGQRKGILNCAENISAESAETVVSGGIGFATPISYGPQATNGTIFTLNEKEAESWKEWWPAIPVPNVPDIGEKTNTLPKYNLQ